MLNNSFNGFVQKQLGCSLAPVVLHSVTTKAFPTAARIVTTE